MTNEKKGRELFSCTMDGDMYHFEIEMPKDEEGCNQLVQAVARLMATTACRVYNDTDLACHHGCLFAGMIDMAHKLFHDTDKEEYHRIVDAGLLTKATNTGSKH
jgi:hypothetical protein